MTSRDGWGIFVVGAAVGFVFGTLTGATIQASKRDDPPCRYGATPRIVIEQDGEPRKVCGCSGGIEVPNGGAK